MSYLPLSLVKISEERQCYVYRADFELFCENPKYGCWRGFDHVFWEGGFGWVGVLEEGLGGDGLGLGLDVEVFLEVVWGWG